MNTQQIKPGYKSSELYITLVTQLVGLGVMLGYVPADQADTFINAIISVIGGLMVIIPTVVYIASRIRLKQTAVASGTNSSSLPISDTVLNTPTSQQFYPR